MESIETLQALRAFAASFVVLCHINSMMAAHTKHAYASPILRAGVSGVDLFFVLSGFIIYYTSSKRAGTTTAGEFLIRRFVRVFPLYWVSVLATLGLVMAARYFSPMWWSQSRTCRAVEEGGLKLILFSICLVPTDTPIVGVSWTLGFEAVFYLLFGLLFFRQPRFFAAGMLLWVALSFLGVLHTAHSSLMAAEFVFGCVIAILVLRGARRFWIPTLVLGIVLFISLGALSIDFLSIPKNAHYRVIVFGLPAALIIYGVVPIRSRIPRFLTYLGDASYSIYLFHSLLLILIGKALSIFNSMEYFNNGIGTTSLFLLIASTGCCIYAYVEKPMLSLCRKRLAMIGQIAPRTWPNS